ncbi:MAG: response regulator [Candidatus Riflebacteria bacterium]|nr:response regulator [Candidatus Riflebacteria bacterium]
MAVITVFAASHCNGQEISLEVARQLGYDFVDESFLDGVAAATSVPPARLRRAMYGPPGFFDGLTHERRRNVARIREAFADLLRKDNLVYLGFAGHLVPRSIPHVLSVCLIANRQHRLRLARQAKALSSEEADEALRADDEESLQWTRYLFDVASWDESLYDLFLPVHDRTVQDCVELICKAARSDAVATTPRALESFADFLVEAKVTRLLREAGHDARVECSGGRVTLTIERFVFWLGHQTTVLSELARGVPGVREVEVQTGPEFYSCGRHSPLSFELPLKVLLVDDEKEFVEALSQRLQARKLDPSVAYDGTEALERMRNQEQDVLVLDLRMPGIDGMEVLRRAKKEHPLTEVIILTGHGSEKDEALARELGAFAYFQKPVDFDQLARAMREAQQKVKEARERLAACGPQAEDDEVLRE